MLHIPAFTLDGRVGLSAIRYGVDVFGSVMSAEDAANGTFKNGLLPTVAFKVDRILQPAQREEFREYVKSVSGAMNAGRSLYWSRGSLLRLSASTRSMLSCWRRESMG